MFVVLLVLLSRGLLLLLDRDSGVPCLDGSLGGVGIFFLSLLGVLVMARRGGGGGGGAPRFDEVVVVEASSWEVGMASFRDIVDSASIVSLVEGILLYAFTAIFFTVLVYVSFAVGLRCGNGGTLS